MSDCLLTDLVDWKKSEPSAIALAQKGSDGNWSTLSTTDYAKKVGQVACSLESLGWRPGDRALILARNCPEWLFVDLGVGLAKGICGGLYNNSSLDDFYHVFQLVKPRILFVEDADAFARIPIASTKSVERIVTFRGEADFDDRAMSFEVFLSLGKSVRKCFEDLVNGFDSSQPSFIVFTSGTTGAPKAALLSHDNIYFAASCYRNRWNAPAEGKLYSFLPASHVAEKVYSLGHGLHFRYPVYFASDLTNVLAEMREVQPLAFLATPRIWQKIMEKVQLGLSRVNSGVAAKLLKQARSLSVESIEQRFRGQKLPLFKRIYFAYLDKKILLPIRTKLGLSKTIKAVSGAAALPENVRHFFRGLGINIIEAYGQTESSGILSGQLGDEDCAGTIGFPVPELEVKISEEGELMTKGRHVFCGYLDSQSATDEVLKEGWLHTGDLAEWNANGQIVFIGRRRDIIKPLEGKMIAPTKIEAKLMLSEVISQAVVFGDGEKFLIALLSPDLSRPSTKEQLNLEISNFVRTLNRSLARHERIQKYLVLDREFSMENGELTPTLKTKRYAIKQNFKPEIERMYGRNSDLEGGSLYL
ncbi:AMP-binding protein [bacterium]|nr:AMP-binding protein [bacterium]